MMKKIFAIFILLTGYALPAQPVIVKWSLAPLGGTATTSNGDMKIIFAAGELAHRETSAIYHMSEGFIDRFFGEYLKTDDFMEMAEINVYPNPVRRTLHVELPQAGGEIYLFDLNGKEVYRTRVESGHVRIEMEAYETSVYLLAVINREKKEYKIIKIRKL
jgi:hypothetical protein